MGRGKWAATVKLGPPKGLTERAEGCSSRGLSNRVVDSPAFVAAKPRSWPAASNTRPEAGADLHSGHRIPLETRHWLWLGG